MGPRQPFILLGISLFSCLRETFIMWLLGLDWYISVEDLDFDHQLSPEDLRMYGRFIVIADAEMWRWSYLGLLASHHSFESRSRSQILEGVWELFLDSEKLVVRTLVHLWREKKKRKTEITKF